MPSNHYTTRFAERDDVEFSFLRLFTQPNVPDVRAHLLSQDVILVEGGSVVNRARAGRAPGRAQVRRAAGLAHWRGAARGPLAGGACAAAG
jgi:hypothetical protein